MLTAPSACGSSTAPSNLAAHRLGACRRRCDNQHAPSYYNTVKLFNVNDGAVVHAPHRPGALPGVPDDGRRFVSGSDDNTVRIVEIW